MKPDCLFCKLVADNSNLIWQNDDYAAFKDINPKARVHVLVVPKQHVDSLDHLQDAQAPGFVRAIQEVAKHLKVAGGYRIQVNVGRAGGQEIDHLHAHVLAS